MLERIVKEKHGAGRRIHYIYTREEADAIGLKYVPWHKAEVGQWALSDDGFVGECLFTRWYPHKGRHRSEMDKYVRTSYGRTYFHPRSKKNSLTVRDRQNYSGITGKASFRSQLRSGKKEIAERYARGESLEEAVDKLISSRPELGFRNWKKVMKNKEFREMLQKEIDKKLKEHGLGVDETMQMIADAAEIAREKGNVKGLISVATLLATMHGIKEPKKIKVTDSYTANKLEDYSKKADGELMITDLRGTRVIEREIDETEPEIIDAEVLDG